MFLSERSPDVDHSIWEPLTLEDATVVAESATHAIETTTDADGSYELEDVPGERAYDVTIEATGYRANVTNSDVDGTLTHDEALWAAHDGAGTDTDPYRVTDVYELQSMAADLEAQYVLESDIDASETDAWNGGAGFAPIGDDAGSSSGASFAGTFDGQGHAIEDLFVDRPGDDYVGLFGAVDHPDATIESVALENATVLGESHVGGLVGALSDGQIDGVHVSGAVSGGEVVGGVAGIAGDVSASSANATVSGGDSVGGLIGQGDGTVSQSFAVGEVDGGSAIGGLVGDGSATVVDSYWDAERTTQDHSVGSPDSDGLNTTELASSNVTDATTLEFEQTWAALDSEYPIHAWMVDGIALTLEETELEPGDETTATVTVDRLDGSNTTATETATYSSSETNVTVVDNATVEAVDDGAATITASLVGFEASAPVEVETVPDAPRETDISVTKLEVSETTVSIGESVTATATLENAGNRGSSYTVESFINGERNDEHTTVVGPYETQTVRFTHTFEESGEYTFAVEDEEVTLEVRSDEDDPVEADDDAGVDDASGDDAGVDDDTGVDDDASEDDSDGDVSVDDAGVDDDVVDSDSTDDDDTIPGFGVLITLAVLSATLLLIRRTDR